MIDWSRVGIIATDTLRAAVTADDVIRGTGPLGTEEDVMQLMDVVASLGELYFKANGYEGEAQAAFCSMVVTLAVVRALDEEVARGS